MGGNLSNCSSCCGESRDKKTETIQDWEPIQSYKGDSSSDSDKDSEKEENFYHS